MQLNMHPAPGIHKLPPGFIGMRHNAGGVGTILETGGFSVPDRDMNPPMDYRMGIGEILETQGFAVPNRDMNPVAAYVSGNVRPIGTGVGCCGTCATGASLNGVGVGAIADDFAAIQNDFSTANYMGILSAPIMGIPYAIPIAVAALMILPGLLGGSGGRKRR
jgi:hypothetical protein